MSPVSRRTGKRYAAGSQTTWRDGDSRVCCHCGERVNMSSGEARHGALWIHTDDVSGERRTSHVACGSPLKAVA